MDLPRCSATKVQERVGSMGVYVVDFLIRQERQEARSLAVVALAHKGLTGNDAL